MSPEFTLSSHAQDVLTEREISEQWVWRTLTEPDNIWEGLDGNIHYSNEITERGGRVLHVVVNGTVSPKRVVTAFFDRRLKKKVPNETQN